MTVSELIEELQKLPQDRIVAIQHRDEYGDSLSGVEYDIFPEINHKSNHNPTDEDFNLPEGIVIL